MASFVASLTNRVVCFGGAATQNWGNYPNFPMTWGSSPWGERAMITQFSYGQLVTNAIVMTDASPKSVQKYYTNAFTLVDSTETENLQTQNGYYYVFVKPTVDAEERNLTTYAEDSDAGTVFTSQSVASTTWSDA